MAGRYEYGTEPEDVYRRHDNCGCTTIYENGRQRQDVWSKKKWEVPAADAGAPKPTILTPAQGRALQAKHKPTVLTRGSRSGIIEIDNQQLLKQAVASGSLPLTINPEKQARHMRDAPEYLPGRSYMTITEEETQEIVIKYHGTGIITVTKAGQIKETIVLDKDVGVTVNPDTGEEETTNTIKIHYSKTGVHVVPTKRRDKNDKTQ